MESFWCSQPGAPDGRLHEKSRVRLKRQEQESLELSLATEYFQFLRRFTAGCEPS